MMIFALIGFACIGIVAGVLAGLLGISGGVVTVPCLYFLFKWLGFPQYLDMHMAIGTSLAAMIFNSLSATWYHHQKKGVLWDVVKKMAPGIIVGSVGGALVSYFLPEGILEILFGLFLCILAFRFFKHTKPHEGAHRLPGSFILNLTSFGIGALSNILGIGGGIITVPILIHYKVADKQAIGCSAATGTLISFLGALSYLYFGMEKASSVPLTLGYIYLPAFIVISVFTFIAARYGVTLAYFLPKTQLRRIFAFVLLITGGLMLWGS